MNEKFEYKLVKMLERSSYENIEKLLDSYGNDGWELCAIDYRAFIMKRKIYE